MSFQLALSSDPNIRITAHDHTLIMQQLMERPREAALTVDLKNIDYSTSAGFNIAALIVTVILIALYAIWW